MAPGIENHEHTTETGISLPSTDTDTLLHHSLVTSSPDALKFHAAASLQLQFGQKHDSVAKSDSNNNDNKLIVSPYNEPLHLLDLQTLDTPNQVLAKALTVFKPIRDDYATAPYTESFNWSAVFDFLRDLSETKGYIWKKQDFYVVVFRSILRPDADLDRLHELDAHSHQEAIASGGLLKYWFGSRNGEGENLATCKFSFISIYFWYIFVVRFV